MTSSETRDIGAKCLFCGRLNNEVKLLIKGRTGAYICNVCVHEVYKILQEYEQYHGW